MREYWVYELRAGDWLYIGMTSNVKNRYKVHRSHIKHRQKPEWWLEALEEFPHPDDWKIEVVAGPFASDTLATKEEERRQRLLWNSPKRLWDRCGIVPSGQHRNKTSMTLKGQILSTDTKNKMSLARKEYWACKRAQRFFDWLAEPTT